MTPTTEERMAHELNAVIEFINEYTTRKFMRGILTDEKLLLDTLSDLYPESL